MATAKPTAPSAATLYAGARGLEARYPGVSVRLEWIDGPVNDGYQGWRIEFHASELGTLIRHGLVTQADLDNAVLPDGRQRDMADEFGHSRYAHCGGRVALVLGFAPDPDAFVVGVHVPDFIPEGHHSERRVHTKKMQRQVAKLLKRAFALPRKEVRL